MTEVLNTISGLLLLVLVVGGGIAGKAFLTARRIEASDIETPSPGGTGEDTEREKKL